LPRYFIVDGCSITGNGFPTITNPITNTLGFFGQYFVAYSALDVT